MELLLRCRVHPGQFSSEYGVVLDLMDGERDSLFAEKWYVIREPTLNDHADGWLRVKVVEVRDDLALVWLPDETFNHGQVLWFPREQFREWPATVEVRTKGG